MTLPTFLVILFLVQGEVYSEVIPAPSPIVCEHVASNIRSLVTKNVAEAPKFYAASCITLQPHIIDS